MYSLDFKKSALLSAAVVILVVTNIAVEQGLSQDGSGKKAGIAGACFSGVSMVLISWSLRCALRLSNDMKVKSNDVKFIMPGVAFAASITTLLHSSNLGVGFFSFVMSLLAATINLGKDGLSNVVFLSAILNAIQIVLTIGSGFSVYGLNSLFNSHRLGNEETSLMKTGENNSTVFSINDDAIKAQEQLLIPCIGY